MDENKLKSTDCRSSIMEKDAKNLLKGKIKKQLSIIEQLPNSEEVLTKIRFLAGKNPSSNIDVDVFLKAIGKKDTGKATKRQRRITKEREINILLMSGFLWKYEGTYLTCIDIMCYMLVATGHDLFNSIKRQYVDSIEEIGEVDLSTKLKFLDRHDFGLINRKQDQKLRNKIAHHDYYFDEDGEICSGNEYIHMRSRFSDFAAFAGDVYITICNCIAHAYARDEVA